MKREHPIVHLISSLAMGGAERVLVDVVTALHQQGYRQEVIFFHDGPMRIPLEEMQIPLHHITGVLFQYDFLFWWRLYSVLYKVQPTIIHASLWSAGFSGRLIGRLLNVPVITAVHAQLSHYGTIRLFLDQLTIRSNDSFIAVSESIAQSIPIRFSQVSSGSIACIANGIDIGQLDRIRNRTLVSRMDCGLLPEHQVVASVGRFVPVKRYDLLITVCAQLSREFPLLRLLLVGVGPLEQQLKLLATELSISDRVIFIVGCDARAYYPIMDIFVQTSATEGLSIALLEAMGHELPCIVSCADEKHPVITQDVDGIIIPTIDELNRNLRILLADSAARVALGREARNTVVRNHSVAHMAQRYLQAFGLHQRFQ